MNSFIVRRLIPVLMFSLLIEAVELLILAVLKYQELDLGFFSMVKTSGVLLLTTAVSTLYLMLPYVFYLLFSAAQMAKFRSRPAHYCQRIQYLCLSDNHRRNSWDFTVEGF